MSDIGEETGDGWGAPSEVIPNSVVRIRMVPGSRLVRAYTFGSWAVHRATNLFGVRPHPHPESWAVSHVPSGCSVGIAAELTFWDAIRIARALDDTGLFPSADLSEPDGCWIFEAAIGAALHDHYVWPLSALGGLP